MSFVSHNIIRFADVDPAGIVFYPRYFEKLNGAVEDWFAQVVGVDFATLHMDLKLGVPTVSIEADFSAPCRLGERVDIVLDVERLGTSSLGLRFAFQAEGETRLKGRATLVCMSLETHRSAPWPEAMRPHMQPD